MTKIMKKKKKRRIIKLVTPAARNICKMYHSNDGIQKKKKAAIPF